jgi:hypothetical protein
VVGRDSRCKVAAPLRQRSERSRGPDSLEQLQGGTCRMEKAQLPVLGICTYTCACCFGGLHTIWWSETSKDLFRVGSAVMPPLSK